MCKVEVPEQQTVAILLIDSHNCEYEELLDDMTNEANEDEFDESDDLRCDDNSNDESK